MIRLGLSNSVGGINSVGPVSPLPTPSVTPSISITPSITPSISITPSKTPSITPTPSASPQPVYTFNLVYDDTSCINACAGIIPGPYYSTSSTLAEFSVLYNDLELTTPVSNGYYSEGNNSGNCYTITDGIGTIDSVSVCPP